MEKGHCQKARSCEDCATIVKWIWIVTTSCWLLAVRLVAVAGVVGGGWWAVTCCDLFSFFAGFRRDERGALWESLGRGLPLKKTKKTTKRKDLVR